MTGEHLEKAKAALADARDLHPDDVRYRDLLKIASIQAAIAQADALATMIPLLERMGQSGTSIRRRRHQGSMTDTIQIIIDGVLAGDEAATIVFAAALTSIGFPSMVTKDGIDVTAGDHHVRITERQVRQMACDSVLLADELGAGYSIVLAFRAQMHLLVMLLTEVADCGSTHALVEVLP